MSLYTASKLKNLVKGKAITVEGNVITVKSYKTGDILYCVKAESLSVPVGYDVCVLCTQDQRFVQEAYAPGIISPSTTSVQDI